MKQNFSKKIKAIINDERAQGEGGALYMLLIVAIVAVVLIAVVKPMFNNSLKTSVKKAALPGAETQAPTK